MEMTRKLVMIVVALQFLATPSWAQVASDTDKNAHHYSGGPKTEVPHMMNHLHQDNVAPKAHVPTSHHYSGGPQNPSHHMGDKQ
jgi:hypothetical protein